MVLPRVEVLVPRGRPVEAYAAQLQMLQHGSRHDLKVQLREFPTRRSGPDGAHEGEPKREQDVLPGDGPEVRRIIFPIHRAMIKRERRENKIVTESPRRDMLLGK